MAAASDPFRHRFRVRYAEVDQQGVVFNSRYLEYADLVISEYWRAIGIHGTGDEPLEFHVAHAGIDFVRPVRPDEVLEGRAWTERVGTSSLTTRIDLAGMGGDDVRARVTLVNVHVDLASGRPRPLPLRVPALFGDDGNG